MIRTNLSTRPFYNERAVRFWLIVLAAIVGVATVVNIIRVIGYSQSDTELATQASGDESRAAGLRAEAARLRGTVNLSEIELASTEARQANALIDRRTFSWTELLNQFETTFPANVRITAVRPQIGENGGMLLTMNVVARSVDDVDALMRNLEETGSFSDLLSVQESFDADGLLSSIVEGTYLPGRTPPPTAAPGGSVATPEAKQP